MIHKANRIVDCFEEYLWRIPHHYYFAARRCVANSGVVVKGWMHPCRRFKYVQSISFPCISLYRLFPNVRTCSLRYPQTDTLFLSEGVPAIRGNFAHQLTKGVFLPNARLLDFAHCGGGRDWTVCWLLKSVLPVAVTWPSRMGAEPYRRSDRPTRLDITASLK